MAEHPFVRSAVAATSDPSAHEDARATAVALEALLAAALTCDRDAARERLPAALVTIQREVGRLVAQSLVPGFTWADDAHRRLAARARELFGPTQTLIPPPPELLARPFRP
jgi:hypothetical protein